MRENGCQMTRMSTDVAVAGRISIVTTLVLLLAVICNDSTVALQRSTPPIIQSSSVINPARLAPLISAKENSLSENYNPLIQAPDTTIELVDFRDEPLGDAMRLSPSNPG